MAHMQVVDTHTGSMIYSMQFMEQYSSSWVFTCGTTYVRVEYQPGTSYSPPPAPDNSYAIASAIDRLASVIVNQNSVYELLKTKDERIAYLEAKIELLQSNQ